MESTNIILLENRREKLDIQAFYGPDTIMLSGFFIFLHFFRANCETIFHLRAYNVIIYRQFFSEQEEYEAAKDYKVDYQSRECIS